MKTAVQLLAGASGGPRCEILCGTAIHVADGTRGPVAVFPGGQVVAYVVHGRKRPPHLYVFRTLSVRDRLAASVPGVWPEVQLLIEARSAGRVRLARGLFTRLLRNGMSPSKVHDHFYVRASAALGGRPPSHNVLFSLLCPAVHEDRRPML